PEQVMADRQVAALGQLEKVCLDGKGALVPRLPLGFSLTPAAIQGPPPKVGEHSRAILHEAGYSEEEIRELLSEPQLLSEPRPEGAVQHRACEPT
ncbi:MAG TPA: hypothetical protein VH640_08330, partial [Bryobacteraceae bacterium]